MNLAFERRVINACATVQEELNCCVSFHPGRHYDSPAEVMRIFQEAGGKAEKTIMSHLESERQD
jgi:predicted metal-dependent phosphotriesterase family hydrolase